MRASIAVLVLLVLGLVRAPAQTKELRVSRDEVETILKYLAADELLGRDTPSAGLKHAQEWSLKRFQSSGLEPGLGEDGWFFHYEMPGWQVELESCEAKLRVGSKEITLVPVDDFRFYSATKAFDLKDQVCARMDVKDAVAKGLLMRRTLENPVILEVDVEDLQWLDAAEGKGYGKRRDLGAPILLVRKGLIPAGKIKIDLKSPEPVDAPYQERNLVGLLRGSMKPDEYVMVTAHLDHVGVGLPKGKDKTDTIYNGANDNGTGSTAVLELARVFAALPADQRPRRSILFVLFSGEEKGLIGSRAMAQRSPWPLEQIAVQVNMEMLGRPERGKTNMAWVTGASHSDFEDIAKTAFERAGLALTTFGMAEQLYRQSDNWPYVEVGVVAHSISASGLQGIDYHMPGDEADKIDYKHMTRVIDGIAELVLEFANRQERPRRKD